MERTTPDTIPIGVWLKERDFQTKLNAALEQIFTGQGWAIFEGLQVTGEVNLKLFFDGAAVSLHKLERLMPEPITIIGEKGHGMDAPFMGEAAKADETVLMSSIRTEPPDQSEATAEATPEPEAQPDQPPKRKRKPHAGTLAPDEDQL